MKKYYFLFFLPLVVLTQCTVYGFTNDYKKLSDREKTLIHSFTNMESVQPKHIYKINALQLRNELKKNEKSLVYVFTNGCSSDLCRPMIAYENYAKENGYTLFLVMTGYGHLNQTLVQNFNSPLFAIDNDFYDSSIRFKYCKKFENQLEGKPINAKQEYKGSIYIFQKDKLIEIKRDIE
ncbi:MAG: hypothetical protein CSA38_03875 [Flavobacteriales bacterium]|nr:MAG: hypothetical protein CSA38_03875 [Flavobacteriales bacterium]